MEARFRHERFFFCSEGRGHTSFVFSAFYIILYCVSLWRFTAFYDSIFLSSQNQKSGVDEQNGCRPGKRKRMIQHEKRRICSKYRKDPDDSERASAEHRADRRIQRVAAAAKHPCRNFIQIADRFKEENAENSHGCAFDDSWGGREKAGEKISTQHDGKDWNGAAQG